MMNQKTVSLEQRSACYLRQIIVFEIEVKKVPGLQINIQQLKKKLTRVEKGKEVSEKINVKNCEIDNLRSHLLAPEKVKKKYA